VADVQLDNTGLDTVLVAENREGVVDKLQTLSEEQDRIEAREGQLETTTTEYLTLDFDFTVNWNVRLLERTFIDQALRLGQERPETGSDLILEGGETVTVADGETREQSGVTQARGSTLTVEQGGTLDTDAARDSETFDPIGGELGFEFPTRPNVLTVAGGETVTVVGGETRRQSEINQAQDSTLTVERGGTLETDVENGPTQTTKGGTLTDGFKSQTVLTDTNA
jgi:hypothetical protein